MAESASPCNVSDLVQFIADYVRRQFDQTGGRTTGAVLANAIREKFPGFEYKQVGLSRLADAVGRAEQEGVLVRHRDVKHLEVSPSEATPRSPVVSAGTSSSYVHADVWRAFLFVNDEKHFLDRESGRLVTLAADDTREIETYKGDTKFAQIDSIAPDIQKDWMRQFVTSQPSLAIDDAPIDEERWWIAFSRWLQEQDAEHILAWRRFRAEKVVRLVREWAKQNDVPATSLFTPQRPRPRSEILPTTYRGEDEATKRAILSAIREMPLEQLENLSVPVRYLLRHFKAR